VSTVTGTLEDRFGTDNLMAALWPYILVRGFTPFGWWTVAPIHSGIRPFALAWRPKP